MPAPIPIQPANPVAAKIRRAHANADRNASPDVRPIALAHLRPRRSSGTRGKIRTSDLAIRSRLLCPLSYAGTWVPS